MPYFKIMFSLLFGLLLLSCSGPQEHNITATNEESVNRIVQRAVNQIESNYLKSYKESAFLALNVYEQSTLVAIKINIFNRPGFVDLWELWFEEYIELLLTFDDDYSKSEPPGLYTLLVRSVPEPAVYLKTPYVLPCDSFRIISGFYAVRRRKIHQGTDFMGTGPNAGLGVPIYSIGKAKIKRIGLSAQEPKLFGTVLKKKGTVKRGKRTLPVSEYIDGYGKVYYFTRKKGKWRSGNVVVTELLEGPLAGYTVRYLHLGAVNPRLKKGDIVWAGEEIGLMGGTAVQESVPHLHMDGETPEGVRIDLEPYLDFDGIIEKLEDLVDRDITGC